MKWLISVTFVLVVPDLVLGNGGEINSLRITSTPSGPTATTSCNAYSWNRTSQQPVYASDSDSDSDYTHATITTYANADSPGISCFSESSGEGEVNVGVGNTTLVPNIDANTVVQFSIDGSGENPSSSTEARASSTSTAVFAVNSPTPVGGDATLYGSFSIYVYGGESGEAGKNFGDIIIGLSASYVEAVYVGSAGWNLSGTLSTATENDPSSSSQNFNFNTGSDGVNETFNFSEVTSVSTTHGMSIELEETYAYGDINGTNPDECALFWASVGSADYFIDDLDTSEP